MVWAKEQIALSHFLSPNDLCGYEVPGLKISNPDFWPSRFLCPWNGTPCILPARGLLIMFTQHSLFLFKVSGIQNYFRINWSTVPDIFVWNMSRTLMLSRFVSGDLKPPSYWSNMATGLYFRARQKQCLL